MRKIFVALIVLLCSTVALSPAEAKTRRKAAVVVRIEWPSVKEHIAACESGGNYLARNRHSTASGKYQFLNSTWAGRYGVKRAYQASPEQQEQAAAELFNNSGTRPWKASERCWKKRMR